jgi:serine phosphatase RsbU (regulator of sigma subunit)/CHASE3 domain sensor protein
VPKEPTSPTRSPSLQQRLDLISLVAVAGLLLMTAAAVVSLLQLRQSYLEEADRVRPAELVEQQLVVAVVNQETGLRGYLLSGEPSFLQPYRQGISDEATAERQLAANLSGDPPAIGMLDQARGAAEAWRHQAEPAALSLGPAAQSTAPPDAATMARRQQALMRSKVLFDALRNRLDVLGNHLTVRAGRASLATRHAWVALLVTLGVSTLAALAGIGWARRQFQHWIRDPLRELAHTVSSVSSSGEGPAVATPPAHASVELGSLTLEIESMRERLHRELESAAEANRALRQRGATVLALAEQLRPRVALVPGLQVAGTMEPAEGVLAGDWLDVLDLDEGRWCLVLGDVSGHGAEAGILALRIKGLLIPLLRAGMSPGAALRFLGVNMEDWGESFATLLVLVGDTVTPEVRYSSAGHPEPLLRRAGRTSVERLQPTGPLLTSVTGEADWRTETVRLDVGDWLIAYTDGVVDSRGQDGEEFGLERLEELVLDAAGGANELATAAMRSMIRFQPRGRDDRTLVVLRRTALIGSGLDGGPPEVGPGAEPMTLEDVAAQPASTEPGKAG